MGAIGGNPDLGRLPCDHPRPCILFRQLVIFISYDTMKIFPAQCRNTQYRVASRRGLFAWEFQISFSSFHAFLLYFDFLDHSTPGPAWIRLCRAMLGYRL